MVCTFLLQHLARQHPCTYFLCCSMCLPVFVCICLFVCLIVCVCILCLCVYIYICVLYRVMGCFSDLYFLLDSDRNHFSSQLHRVMAHVTNTRLLATPYCMYLMKGPPWTFLMLSKTRSLFFFVTGRHGI